MKTVGGLIDALRNGEVVQYRHDNPYLNEALDYSDILFTQQSLIKQPNILESLRNNNLIVEIGCYFGKNSG